MARIQIRGYPSRTPVSGCNIVHNCDEDATQIITPTKEKQANRATDGPHSIGNLGIKEVHAFSADKGCRDPDEECLWDKSQNREGMSLLYGPKPVRLDKCRDDHKHDSDKDGCALYLKRGWLVSKAFFRRIKQPTE